MKIGNQPHHFQIQDNPQMTLYVRTFKNQEADSVRAIAIACSVPFRLVQRARLSLQSAAGYSPPQIGPKVGLSVAQERKWAKRFNTAGLMGLFDLPGPGAPPRLTEAQTVGMIEIVTIKPTELALAFNTWSLSHLRRFLG